MEFADAVELFGSASGVAMQTLLVEMSIAPKTKILTILCIAALRNENDGNEILRIVRRCGCRRAISGAGNLRGQNALVEQNCVV
jgi:hypothetical protein